MSEDKAVMEQIDQLRADISTLRKQLSDINNEKETLFKKRQEIGCGISSLIKDVKGTRNKRDALTKGVRMSKGEREKLNDQIRDKINQLKDLKMHAKDAKSRDSPGRLKREIERLNYKIETEAMSFDKEQKMMKAIKDLKKRYDAAEKSFSGWRKVKELSKEIDDLKSIANQAHEKVQEAAKESQTKHEDLLSTSKKIDTLKEEEAEILKQIAEKKDLMAPIIKELDEKNAEMRALRKKAGLAAEEEKKFESTKQKKKLSELQAEVNEKIKKGAKLTTEDLLILQSGETE